MKHSLLKTTLTLALLLALSGLRPLPASAARPPGSSKTPEVLLDAAGVVISDIRTSNVRDTTFTVSWVTDQPAGGEVRYGSDPGNLNQVAADDRGAGTSDDTHHVTLTGLSPESTWYFDVVSDGTVDDNGGAHYNATTGPTLSLPPSDVIYGQVFHADGSTPAAGTIVYVTLFDDDGSGDPGQAAPLSALVDASGYWNANPGNARRVDLGGSATPRRGTA